jgi:hypothetical protein
MHRRIALVVALLAIAAPAAAAPPSVEIAANKALIWRVSHVVFGSHASTAFCIATWETGHTWSPTAGYPHGGNWGVWQINVGTWNPSLNPSSPFSPATWARVLQPWTNARMALHISRGGTDWHQWSTHRLCGV